MKKILYLLFSIMIISCSTSRKVKTDLETLNQNHQVQTQSDSGTAAQSGSTSKVDLSRMIDEFGLVIKGDGNQYSLNYGGLQFIGSADLELKKKTDRYQVINIYQHWDVFHNWNVTKTQEITKTNSKKKSKDIEAQKDSLWLYVLIFCGGMLTMAVLIYLWKKYNPLQSIKKWIK
jgi:hypothetical protein